MASSNGLDRYESPSIYDSMRCPGKISAYSESYYSESRDDDSFSASGNQHECDWPVIPNYAKGDNIKMSPPPRKIRATNAVPEESKTLPSLSSKYPQTRRADPQKRLFESSEEALLNDLDETTENEKLRKQIFKLNRRLTTLEKQSKEEHERFKMCAVVLSCGLFATMVYSMSNRFWTVAMYFFLITTYLSVKTDTEHVAINEDLSHHWTNNNTGLVMVNLYRSCSKALRFDY